MPVSIVPRLSARPRAFAACLGSVRGKEAIAHLRRVFLERRLPPTASDAELWHLEGQRSVVAHIVALVERGRQSPTPDGADGSHG